MALKGENACSTHCVGQVELQYRGERRHMVVLSSRTLKGERANADAIITTAGRGPCKASNSSYLKFTCLQPHRPRLMQSPHNCLATSAAMPYTYFGKRP